MYSFDCPRCGGSDIVKRGKRYNLSGSKQLYRCNDCRSAFVEPNGFERMRHQPEDIVRGVHQHNDGFSLFQVQYHLTQHDNVDVSRETIRRWVKRYSSFLKSASSAVEAKAQRQTAS